MIKIIPGGYSLEIHIKHANGVVEAWLDMGPDRDFVGQGDSIATALVKLGQTPFMSVHVEAKVKELSDLSVLPTPDAGGAHRYRYPDKSYIVKSFMVPGKWIARIPDASPLLGDGMTILFDSPLLAADALAKAGFGPGAKPPGG